MPKNLFNFFIVTEDGSFYPSLAGNIALLIIIGILFIAILALSGGNKKLSAKQLAFSAVAMTMAVITSIFTVYELPFGGSITLFRMFFICFIGYLYGSKVGIITGVAYGILDFILKPFAITLIQPLLDYPVAFGCLGLAGVFSKSKHGLVKGYILGVAGRYICHVLTGIIYFYEYAEGKNVVIYSLTYNASYIVPEAVLTIGILLIPTVKQAFGLVKEMALES
ncbi:MAG: proton-coupled thiamine transporter YuaJ [Clostridiales bacterium]|jgi:thiamine transporter|nr:energy-coupled thiamine transporter ThiT [Bacillota bacterium]NLK02939.1 proton-coupled thiamine transporter YuaJ [Clostridiales bacterium]